MGTPAWFWPILIGITFLGMVFYSSKKLNIPLKTLTMTSLGFILVTYLYSLL